MSRVRAAFALAWRAAPGGLCARAVITGVMAGLPIAAAWQTKVVIDRLTAPAAQPLVPAILLAACGLAMALLPHLQRYVEAESLRAISFFLRTRLFAALARQAGLARLEDPSFHDRLALAVHAGQSGPAQVVTQLLTVAQGLIVVTGFVIALALLSPVLTAIVLIFALPALRAELVLSRQRSQLAWELSESSRREMFYAELLANVTAAKEIRVFGLGDYFGGRQRKELRAINSQIRALDRRELGTQAALAALAAGVAGGGLIWAILSARSGQLTIGDVSMLIAGVAGVQTGLHLAVSNLGQTHESLLFFDHYRAVTDAGPDLEVATRPVAVPKLKHGIEFRDVWFRYSDQQPWVLKGVTFTIEAGRATALVGLNGAGKSTIVKLLCRLYDPEKGAILWDGHDLRTLQLDGLRRRTGAVFQDFMQYDLTVAENIGMGEVSAISDRTKIVSASTAAGTSTLVDALPAGYDTLLSRLFSGPEEHGGGSMLSGGQWQRIAVARGLMRGERELLILDEPSSGLDADAEHEIHTRLRRLRRDRTSLLISHRLSTVRDASTIVVIADGVVTEQGTHDELMDSEGEYARLFTTQASGYR